MILFKKSKAYSLQSVILGSVLTAIVGGAGMATMWSSIEKGKVTTIASIIKEQVLYVNSINKENFQELEDIQNKINIGGDGDQDYLDELMEEGKLSKLPLSSFNSPESLTWEIRKITEDGYKKLLYIHLKTNDAIDIKRISEAREKLNVPDSLIYTKDVPVK